MAAYIWLHDACFRFKNTFNLMSVSVNMFWFVKTIKWLIREIIYRHKKQNRFFYMWQKMCLHNFLQDDVLFLSRSSDCQRINNHVIMSHFELLCLQFIPMFVLMTRFDNKMNRICLDLIFVLLQWNFITVIEWWTLRDVFII